MTAPVDVLLSHLDAVRQTGDRRWSARCPAHDDRGPSLSIRELDDARVLVHCFSGCAVGDVVAAVGLRLDDLFPPRGRADHRVRGERRSFPAVDVLRAVAHEAMIVAVSASFMGNGSTLTDEDRARLLVAAERIQAAMEETGHA